MTLKPGWINRQFARVERETEHWPKWLLEDINQRAEEHRAAAISDAEDQPLAAQSKSDELSTST